MRRRGSLSNVCEANPPLEAYTSNIRRRRAALTVSTVAGRPFSLMNPAVASAAGRIVCKAGGRGDWEGQPVLLTGSDDLRSRHDYSKDSKLAAPLRAS